jgi:RNase adaptor protein for sRNA GlmZ degradation
MLKVRIFSFSYLYNGLPEDTTDNGGGFIFDCRFIYNPGRNIEFYDLTGKDEAVKNFLDKQQEMQEFLKNTFNIINPAIENYISRNFTDLMVSFGCTGGQHRSVYSAQKLEEHIHQKYPEVKTELTHINL